MYATPPCFGCLHTYLYSTGLRLPSQALRSALSSARPAVGYRGRAASTPMFRKADGTAFTTDEIRAIVRQLCLAIGEDPLLFGAHSLRIGGATALFAAGAEPIHIRTMGRWSSDCYRLYVRACFEQTIAWTRKLGSQQVHDVQGTYERRAQETEEY